ncbi:MAG: hypothetical protein J1F64_01515 [Oscillospiraceae bacterium]|nr:hypothetical protein [Oscillospiraceae bacterium]
MDKNKKEVSEKKESGDIIEILDCMEDTVTKAPVVWLTNKVIIEREDILDYISEIRNNYPAAMREAKWVKSERERILTEAQKRADDIQKNAEKETLRLIDEHQITRQANEEAEVIHSEAENYFNSVRQNADAFAEDVFKNLENKLSKLLSIVRQEHEEYVESVTRDYENNRNNNVKE